MKYMLLALIVLFSCQLLAQALPLPFMIKVQMPDGSYPDSVSIRTYRVDVPEEVRTQMTSPRNIKTVVLDNAQQKGFYVFVSLAAFATQWQQNTDEILVVEITHESDGAAVTLKLPFPPGTNMVWYEKPVTLTYAFPATAIEPKPAPGAKEISRHPELSWNYIQKPGYQTPVAFRLAIATDSTFSDARVAYIKGGIGSHSENLPADWLPLQPQTTYYWKVIPTSSTNTFTSPTSIKEVRINGKLIKSKDNGDAYKVPTWYFSTGN
jgi:hypothetical protein